MFNKKTKGKNMTKIYQKIYTDESGTKPKEIEWTIEELQNSVVNSESINNYYCADRNKGAWLFTDKINFKLENEQWRKCDKIQYYGYEIYASNRGRIKVRKDGCECICALCEEITPGKDINSALFKFLIDNNEKHIGWLKAKISGNKRCLGPYVYQMVADAWFPDYAYGETDGQIHHITNDGYDNRPENLIILKENEHKKIQHYGLSDPRYYPGKYDKK